MFIYIEVFYDLTMYELLKKEVYQEGKIDGEDVLFKHTIMLAEGFSINNYTTIYKQIGSSYAGVYPSHDSRKMLPIIRHILTNKQFVKYMLDNPQIVEAFMEKIKIVKEQENEET